MQPFKPKRIKAKPKKIKTKANANSRVVENTCPNCLSSLKINKYGNWECSGTRLHQWEEEFKRYTNLNEVDKVMYVSKLTNSSLFESLYDKWAKGQLKCNYNNKISLPSLYYSQEIPDPMVVGKIERSLGRLLTEAEKLGESPIYKIGTKFSSDYEIGAEVIEIPKIEFPGES